MKSSTVVNNYLLFLTALLLTPFTEEKQNFCQNSSSWTIQCSSMFCSSMAADIANLPL